MNSIRPDGYLSWFLTGLLVLFIQVFFVPLIEISIWRPDIVILFIIYLGFRKGAAIGTIGGFIFGLFQDSLSVSSIGMSSFANCIVGYITGILQSLNLAENWRYFIVILLILIHGFLFYMLYQYNSEVTYLTLVATRVFPNTVYTFIIGFIFTLIFKIRLREG